MEDLNQSINVTHSPSSTQNEPQTTKEELVLAPDGVGADSSSDGGKSEGGGSGQGVKRGRGRHQKFEVAGNELSPVPASAPLETLTDPLGSPVKRSRGRPRGTGKLQILASMGGCVAETAGGSFTPHVLTVATGEDVISTILSFFQRGSRSVCILSATGSVSSVTIRQPGATNGYFRFEGRFEILSLSGACTYTSGPNGTHCKTGMLNVILAKPDGRVFGGGIENSLVAGGPIQLVLATFKQNIYNPIMKRQSSGSFSTSANMLPGNPDSAREHHQLKVPKLMIEGEKSCPSPTAKTTNGVADNLITNDNKVQSESVTGIDLEGQTLQSVTDQTTSAKCCCQCP